MVLGEIELASDRDRIVELAPDRHLAVTAERRSLEEFAKRQARLGLLASHKFMPGDLICLAGDRLESLHMLERGIVELCQPRNATDCSVLLLSAGDLLFPAAGLFNEPCLTSARAITPVRTVALEIEAVRAEARCNPSVAMDLSRVMGGQWRMAVRHILDLRCRNVSQRLASFLLRLIDESPLPGEAQLPFSKGALAARIGASPETLSRSIQTIASEGLVLRGREIVLRDRYRIEKFCEPSPYPSENELGLEVHAY